MSMWYVCGITVVYGLMSLGMDWHTRPEERPSTCIEDSVDLFVLFRILSLISSLLSFCPICGSLAVLIIFS